MATSVVELTPSILALIAQLDQFASSRQADAMIEVHLRMVALEVVDEILARLLFLA